MTYKSNHTSKLNRVWHRLYTNSTPTKIQITDKGEVGQVNEAMRTRGKRSIFRKFVRTSFLDGSQDVFSKLVLTVLTQGHLALLQTC